MKHMSQNPKFIHLFKNVIYNNKLACLALAFCLTIISCDKDDDDTPTPTNVSNKLEEIDKTFFSQIKKSSDIFDKDQIWKSYHFSKHPKYFIFRDKNKKPIRAYVINPLSKLKGGMKITAGDSYDLKLYRYDVGINETNENLKKGNDYFDFSLKVEGEKYYAQIYSEETVKDSKNGAYQFAVHEVFHVFQGEKWTENESAIQDEKNYPLTKDLLALQILTTKIAAKMPLEKDKTKLENYLKMYVAIRSEEIRLDPTTKKLVKNMANEQEKGEGTAKYIEVMNSYQVDPNFKGAFNSSSTEFIKTKKDLRSQFAFGIWYDTGAAATYMLKTIGVDVESEISTGLTPYDMAVKKLKLTEIQKKTALKNAKDEFGWDDIVKEEQRLLSL